MSYAAHRKDFGPTVDVTPLPADEPQAKPRLLRRMLNAFVNARQRQFEREITAYLARSGGRLTDNLEREMMQRLSRPNWDNRL